MKTKLNHEQKKILMISGIVVGTAALLTYPAILLYRKWMEKKNESGNHLVEDHESKNFAPSYRSHHKPHHRKAENIDHLAQHN